MALDAAWNSLIWIFGIVTLVFILAERVPTDNRAFTDTLMKWDPRRLPAPGAMPPVSRTSSLAEFIANFIALLVLIDAGGAHRLPLDVVLASGGIVVLCLQVAVSARNLRRLRPVLTL